jgi:hypothetical protein
MRTFSAPRLAGLAGALGVIVALAGCGDTNYYREPSTSQTTTTTRPPAATPAPGTSSTTVTPNPDGSTSTTTTRTYRNY